MARVRKWEFLFLAATISLTAWWRTPTDWTLLSNRDEQPGPRLSTHLKIVPDQTFSLGPVVLGFTVYDEHGQLDAGIGKRQLVLRAFGPPPRISRECGREYWCYRLPPNQAGQRLYFNVCFESEFFLDHLTHFVLGSEKFVVFDEENLDPSPPVELQF